MRHLKLIGIFATTGVILSACGGGTGEKNDTSKASNPTYSAPVTYSAVKVFGDSLSDSGTFKNVTQARVFSVTSDSTKIWSEVIAAKKNLAAPCNYYTATGATTFSVSDANCKSFGVGGATINGDAASPTGLTKQLTDAATIGFSSTDLVLIDGGGNDYADFITKFLAISSAATADKPTKITEYATLTGVTLDQGVALYNKSNGTSVASFFPATSTQQTSILVGMGVAGMTTVAQKYFNLVKTNVLDKGATHVVMLNAPSVVDTPKLQEVLGLVSASTKQTAITAGKTEAEATATAKATVAQLDAVFRIWGATFNSALKTKVTESGGGKVLLVDFYTAMNNMVAYPTKFGLTNVKDTACPSTSTDAATGLKKYTFATCTDTELTAKTPPTGATGGSSWWKTYLFSDSFHPTPYGHTLMANTVLTEMTAIGW